MEQKNVEQNERTNRLLPLISNEHADALPIRSDAQVYSCYLGKGHVVQHSLKQGRGAYVYVLEGDPVELNGNVIPVLGAAQVTGAMNIELSAQGDAELLLLDILLDH